MDGTTLPLAADFAAPTRADWMRLIDKTLKDETFESALVAHTADGIAIQPLYTAADAPTAGLRDLAPRDADRPWDLRMATAHPDPAHANAEMLHDLEQGAQSVLVRIDPTGADGVAVGSAEGLARLFEGVLLDLAPVALDAGYLGPKAADWLGTAAKAAPLAPLAFHMDPITAFAVTGESAGPLESHIVSAVTVGARLRTTYPQASLMLATGRAAHEAGGTEAQELALMAASGIAYAKALRRAGVPLDEAFTRIVLGVSVDGEYFTGVAKLRAARALWGRITAACGTPSRARIEARSSGRMLSALDPWTNLLRLTAAGFAAAVGGADSVVLGAFTDARGLPTTFAKRQSRNTQLVLMEESHLGRVADPAGGAWYLESLTDQIARAAWAQFQAIEAAGGVIQALSSGLIARAVGEAAAARIAAIEAKTVKLLGVTVFRDGDPRVAEVETPDPAAFAVAVPDVRMPGPDSACEPLTPIRFAARFEDAAS